MGIIDVKAVDRLQWKASLTYSDLTSSGPLPSNIHVMTWVPQIRVLQHTKLFITHAGADGLLEAIAAGVPMICVQQYCDQFINS